jgi:hypothetical protein
MSTGLCPAHRHHSKYQAGRPKTRNLRENG